MDAECKNAFESTRTESTPWDSSWPEWLSPGEREGVLDYFEQRFGINRSVFHEYQWWKDAHGYGVISGSVHLDGMASMKANKVGMVVLHRIKQYLKPTTSAVQTFGHKAEKNVLEVGRSVLRDLLTNRTMDMTCASDEGYVILRHEGIILGCGLALKDRLMHQLPRWMVHSLLAALNAQDDSSDCF
jgi:NOL1/NOP2/fmu family ribosome biogenesis protein